ncbi:hypothetical protein MKX01_006465, partial [Papaver californicum]
MKKLGIWEKVCHIVGKLSPNHGANNNASSTTILPAGSKRKGSLVLIGFGFVLGASILILTMIFSMFSSLMNPMLQSNLARVYNSSSSTTTTTTTITSIFSLNPPQENTSAVNQIFSSLEILENSTTTSNQTIFSSSPSSNNPAQELLESSTATNQTTVSSSSPDLSRDFIPTNQTESSSTFTNYSSSVVSESVPKVEELVVTNNETNVVTTTSNFSSDSIGLYDEKQQNVNHNSSHSRHDCNIFEGEWVRPANGEIRRPFYPPGSCPYIDRKPFDCFNNGRPDDAFLKFQWHWQSHPTNAGCNNNFP